MKCYCLLRMQMVLHDINQAELARRLGKSTGYISARMAGAGAWTLAEAYRIAALLPGLDGAAIPLNELFPVGDCLKGGGGRG